MEFVTDYPGYIAAECLYDTGLERLEAEDEDDVVVDDKVCAYWLSDYELWGGLLEETDQAGDLLHAETSRMFIRARLATDARKARVNLAGADPSRRKVIEDPYLHFVTMGFPRTHSWVERVKASGKQQDIEEFALSVMQGREATATRLRQAHLLALFRYLPALVSAVGKPQLESYLTPPDVQAALNAMPRRTRAELIAAPGLAIEDALQLIDTRPMLFDQSFTGVD
ncbi:hypothetical protein GCM10010833_29840 [Blastomonas aquatica]|uniref:Uncharacterized protein n=1 Tax=Blastomonas aquatica TaxID=1510276 RepID=A0ABQ1JRD5_9SPHN|nr:hypothetical protein GCM10010833_29840 [Blastomonas aquatica]